MRAALLLLVVGCFDDGTTIDQYPCPSGGTQLTYENFGGDFMSRYCERCHAGNSPNRMGAPPNYAFDTHAEVFAARDRIFANAAADNTSMPPGPNDPPKVERDKLAEWLACGAP